MPVFPVVKSNTVVKSNIYPQQSLALINRLKLNGRELLSVFSQRPSPRIRYHMAACCEV